MRGREGRLLVALAALAACAQPPGPAAPVPRNTAAPAPQPEPPTDVLVGRWRVTGCETSPQDPADCGRGEIVFTADQVTIAIGASDHVPRAYRLIARTPRQIVIWLEGQESTLAIEADGAVRWRAPGLDGRVGRLRFEREPAAPPR